MFKEKFNFENVQHRTAEMTEAFSRIYLIKNKLREKKKGQKVIKNSLPHKGSATVQISNKFIADLKRIAELDTKMTEYDELGRLMKIRKERENLIPKVVDKKKKIRTRRKSRKVVLKKWIINISDD